MAAVTISQIRDGIATRLATITGLRTASVIPDNPNPPQAIVQANTVSYDTAFQGGLTTYNFIVSVLVGRVAERQAQDRLDAYSSTSGTQSVKEAIEGDRSLGGIVADTRVTELTGVSAVLLGEATYLAANFAVTVYAE
jgi:hypothetical protein